MSLNKICITQRGMDILEREKQQIKEAIMKNDRSSFQNIRNAQNNNLMTSRRTSLPLLSRVSNTHNQKSTQKDLSRLSMQMHKLETIGLKKMKSMKQDQSLRNTLLSQLKNNERLKDQKYLRLVIPEVVKKTRDNKIGNLKSRLQRGRAYIQRLQNNYRSNTTRNTHQPRSFDD